MSWGSSVSHMYDSFIPWVRLGLASWVALTIASGVGVWRGWSVAWYLAFTLQLPQVAVFGAFLLGTLLATDHQVTLIGLAVLVFAVPIGVVVLLCQKVVLESFEIAVF